MNNDQEEWGVLESLFLKGEQLTAADREMLLQERLASDHLRSRLWALWRQGDRTESFLAANVLSNFTVFADGRTGANAERYQPGQLLARRFEIQEFLGEGGMGSVYRARDTTLGRVVALKILQWSGVGEEIRQRADREAHVISALNYPGICTLFDMYWDRTTPILVMECLDGETLEQRLARGPLKPEEFRTIGLQICEALSYAHERRVLHGDLKPANIMLTERGAVLLDFGLSRSIGEPAAGVQEDGQAASHVVPQGWVAGTPAYMSPEQIRGQPLDARSDVFSLGCVLYKMASGKGPFHRNSTEDTFQAILKAAPDPPPAQLSGVPRRVRSLIAKCLRLDPNDRFQSVTDITKGLRLATSSRVRAWPTAAGAVLLVAAIGSAAWFGTRREDPPLAMRQVTFDDGLSSWPALSPDGKMLAFASDRGGKGHVHIWIQRVDSRQPVQLTNREDDDYTPAFSADGTRIAFTANRADGLSIYVMPATGGVPKLVAKGAELPQFSPNGKWIAFVKRLSSHQGELVVMPAYGGTFRNVARINTLNVPVWSPDSSAVVSAGYPGSTLGLSYPAFQLFDWFVVPIDGSPAIPLKMRGAFSDEAALPVPVAWQGHRLLCWARAREIYGLWELRVRRDQAWHLDSKPKRLETGLNPDASVSVAGRQLAFGAGDWHHSIGMLRLGASVRKPVGQLERVPGMIDAALSGISPSGRNITYIRSPNTDVQTGGYLRSLATGDEEHFELPNEKIFQVFPTDGSQVLLVAGSASVSYSDETVYVMDVATKKKDLLCTACGSPQMSPDGKWVFARQLEGPWILLMTSGDRHPNVLEGSGSIRSIRFSADGKWIAFNFLSNLAAQRGRIYLAPFQGTTHISKAAWIPVTNDEGDYGSPGWSRDGHVIYYSSGHDGYRCLYAQQLDLSLKRAPGKPIAIYHAHGYPGLLDGFGNLYVARDKLVFELADGRSNIWLADLPPE
jgi:Tol biopolymer transport system component